MLTEAELARYSRQIMLFGTEGQERLKAGRVMVAGAGGLGSAVSLYLAAAGVGHLLVVDQDSVEVSNLNRQILHRAPGMRKAESARAALQEINPGIEVEAVDCTIDSANAVEIARGSDLIVDAMDSFAARYILNQAAIDLGIPFVHGAISGLDGQATTVIPGRTACLQCVFPRPPPATTPPAVGATCGIIGSIQATEAIKLILGKGELLENRLLLWDGTASAMDIVSLKRTPGCPACGSCADDRI